MWGLVFELKVASFQINKQKNIKSCDDAEKTPSGLTVLVIQTLNSAAGSTGAQCSTAPLTQYVNLGFSQCNHTILC